MSIDLRNPITEDGRPKMLLSIITKSLETAQDIWPEATTADLGDLKLYWDTADKAEDAIAKAAWQKAKKLGHAFYQLEKPGDREGKQIIDWSDVDKAKAGRLQSAPPVRGGEEAGEDDEDSDEDDDKDNEDES